MEIFIFWLKKSRKWYVRPSEEDVVVAVLPARSSDVAQLAVGVVSVGAHDDVRRGGIGPGKLQTMSGAHDPPKTNKY